jgi:hypothetical protein
MASRNTIDTNILRIRDVFAINRLNGEFIKPESIPVIGLEGRLKYYSSLEFLSSISVPTASTNVLNLLESIQPGFSTLSSAITYTPVFTSTVAGLGTAGYVSTSYLHHQIDELSYTYKYISATTLYDCFTHLANMQWIGNEAGPMIMGSNLSGGYVSTMNPGQYKIYKSTLPYVNILPNAYDSNSINNTTTVPVAEIDIGGFQNNIVNTSKMTIEIQLNTNVVFTGGLQYNCTFSNFISPYNDIATEIQNHVTVIPAYHSNANICMAKFLLNATDLTPFPGKLRLYNRQFNDQNEACYFITMIPQKNGIFITLDNTD